MGHTSVWFNLLRDATGSVARRVATIVGDDEVTLTRFTQMELLQGAPDDREWGTLSQYLGGQTYIEAAEDTWRDSARIYYDLRRRGVTVRSPIDCCIAQMAIEHRALLLHEDRDFEASAEIGPLPQSRT